MRWASNVARILEKINVHRVLVGKPEGKSPFGNPSGGWEDIVKLVLKEMGWWVWIGFFWLTIKTSRRLL